MTQKNWIPEIMYEDDAEGLSSHIPFIMVPPKEKMPKMLFIFESRETGEFEPGSEGEPMPIIEMELHQYADMVELKKGLTGAEYDKVRSVLGLEPLKTASVKGKEITDKIREKF